ncbi:MAG: hypothetical protein AAF597_09275 [Bacteroidota bacterium]
MTFERKAGTRLGWTLDVGRVANLQVSQQFTTTGVLANERIKVTEFKDFSGYTFLRVGADLQPGGWRKGRLGLGALAYVEGAVSLTGSSRRSVYSTTYDRDITETEHLATSDVGPRAGGRDERLTGADVRRLVLTAGPQVVYHFSEGPQLTVAVLFDLNRRLIAFDGATSRLLFVEAGFNYPLFQP